MEKSMIFLCLSMKCHNPDHFSFDELLRVSRNMGLLTALPTLTLISITSLSTLIMGDLDKNCCEKVYLFSSDSIAETHPLFLGIYQYGGKLENEQPYFYKTVQYDSYDQKSVQYKIYLVFEENGNFQFPFKN